MKTSSATFRLEFFFKVQEKGYIITIPYRAKEVRFREMLSYPKLLSFAVVGPESKHKLENLPQVGI